MIFYPYNMLNEDIYPVFGNQVTGLPHYIDLVSEVIESFDPDNMSLEDATKGIFEEIKKSGKQWGFSGYFENRTRVLRNTRIFREGRIYHVGIDLFAPVGTGLHAPLGGQVVVAEYEDGVTNYGGMIVLKHNINGVVFYSLYGHLNKEFLPKIGQIIKKGELFGKIGDTYENGQWTPHTHLQTLTEEGYNSDWLRKGYCAESETTNIDKYCPNPIFLLRYVQ
jgi:murein DD-endopeptidase MepM/ murein hydrolase activator NlpD